MGCVNAGAARVGVRRTNSRGLAEESDGAV